MKPTSNKKYASVIFHGLVFASILIPANAAAQNRGPSDFLDRRMTPCDFLDPSIAQFEHGKALNRTEADYRARLRQHVAQKSYGVQKDFAYDFMRLRRKVVQAAVPSSTDFDLMDDLRKRPSAYVGRPVVVYGRVTNIQRSNDGTALCSLLAHDSDAVVANVDVVDTRSVQRTLPDGGLHVRVVGFLVKTLEGNMPYFCTQRLEWLTVEINPATFDVVLHKSRGIRQEEATAYYETLTQTRILDLPTQQQQARVCLERRIEERWDQAQQLHATERRQAEQVGMTDEARATDMVRKADAKLMAEQKRHEAYAADPSKFPIFADVFVNPDRYLGKPVTMRGHVRRVMSYDADQDRFASPKLHELWLYTDDSQQNPAVVICSELPPDFPTGDGVVQGITVTGYFFKLYRYAADDANRAAPMLLAHKIEWQAGNTSYAGFGSLGTLATVIAMFVGAALLMYLWSNHEGDRRAREALAMARTVDGPGPEPAGVRFPSPEPLPPKPITRQEPALPPVEPVTPRKLHTPESTNPPGSLPPQPRDAPPVDPLFRPIESAKTGFEQATGRTRDVVSEKFDQASGFVTRQKDRAADFVETQKERATDFVEDKTEVARDFVNTQKERLSSAARSLPSVSLPGSSPKRKLPQTPAPEPLRAATGREIRPSDIVGNQILRVLREDDTGSGSRIELSNGGTLSLDNDIVSLRQTGSGGYTHPAYAELQGMVIDHVATDQWERVYLVAGRNMFITEDFAEDGQRELIFW